ncbi:MAG: amidase family protein [Candidatus Nanohaloarchaea archaeon]
MEEGTVKDFLQNREKYSNKEFLEELKEKNQGLNFMREIEEGEENEGELESIPFLVKDAICTEGTVTSAGSKMLEDYRPVFDATVVERLKESGGQFFGKTNMDEFGFGTFSTNCAFETPKNPHDNSRVVGGSSGGAGAAVAALDYPVISIGESTGGSITNPAAYNGVVGVTPTYGRVSRYGLVDYANSLDKIGVLSKKVFGAAKGLEIIAGEDENDQTTSERPVSAYSDLNERKNLKIGVPRQMAEINGIQEGVKENFEDSLEMLEEVGQVEYFDAPLLSADVTLPAYYILAMAEASTNLAKMSGMRYGFEKDPEEFEDFNEYFSEVRSEAFGDEVKRRILLGTYIRKAGYRDQYYIKAAKVRTKIIEEFKEAFEEYDVLVTPSMPNIAPKIEEAESLTPAEMYAMDSMTVGPNLAGVPQVSIPNGKSEGMPTGLQFLGPHFGEEKLLNIAYTFERLKSE